MSYVLSFFLLEYAKIAYHCIDRREKQVQSSGLGRDLVHTNGETRTQGEQKTKGMLSPKTEKSGYKITRVHPSGSSHGPRASFILDLAE